MGKNIVEGKRGSMEEKVQITLMTADGARQQRREDGDWRIKEMGGHNQLVM